MISTPIRDFARAYAASGAVRAHMPGHKGAPILGCEPWDLTEVDGADELFAPRGIIAESEANAGRLFGARTLYSAEGSSLCIRAMAFLAAGRGRDGARPLIVAGRNAHKAFINACALVDADVRWLRPAPGDSYHACTVTAADVAAALADGAPCAVYLTSPDYLGNVTDIAPIAAVCRARGVPLLVDNAHGAYLKFLPGGSRHPIDLGADLCCDSAHKTLGALTGAAYLHIRAEDAFGFADRARDALALFGSTSPSYLILQSLDLVNPALEGLPARLAGFIPRVDALRACLTAHGFALRGDEPLKITLDAKRFGYTGDALAARLRDAGVVCEFHDPDFVVLMLTPDNAPEDLARVGDALTAIPPRPPLTGGAPAFRPLEQVLSPREARFAPMEKIPASMCAGRVLCAANVGCPPAVPIAMCGERMDAATAARFAYYGIETCEVVKEMRKEDD